jgi:predicted nucleic acid-binding protein
VTEHVVAELAAGAALGRNVPNVQARSWCDIRKISIPAFLKMVPDLGAGEASTIALAAETAGPKLLLLDDALGRRIASLHGPPVTGTAGVLLRAKERRLVTAIRPLLEEMIAAGFYLRPDHLDLLCRTANE